jgi:uncharacterized membrane protein
MDPISAMAAVSAAVNMIKKASATVDDVSSLGPLIGKYFDAKHTATKAAREARKSGGSNMGKAIEIEMALKAQKDFENDLKNLFFSSGNMDVWKSIMTRVVEMDKEDKEEAERDRVREKNRKKRQKELQELFLGIGLLIIILIFGIWALVEFVQFCQSSGRCGK